MASIVNRAVAVRYLGPVVLPASLNIASTDR
jgi:hypothetical protein